MNISSPETTQAGAKAVLGPMTPRDTLAAAGALLILVGSLIPILMVGGYFSNLWMLPGGFFYPLITLVLPIILGGGFAWRRFAGRTELRVGSLTLDQIGSVIALLGTGYFFFAVVATFTPAFLVALIGSLALLAATTLSPYIKPFAADFAPGQGHLLTRAVRPTTAAGTATADKVPEAATVAAAPVFPKPTAAAKPVAPVAPVFEPVAEPVVEPAVEPVAEPVVEPVVQLVEADEFDEVEERDDSGDRAPADAGTPAATDAAVAVKTPAAVDQVIEGNIVPMGLFVEDDAELADIVDAPKDGEQLPPNPAIARLAAAAAATSAAAAQSAEPVGRYEQPSAGTPGASAAEPAEKASASDGPTPVVEKPAAETPVAEAPVVETPVAEAPVVETPVQAAAAKESPLKLVPEPESPATSAQPIASGPAPTAAFSRIDLDAELAREEAAPEAFGATHAGDSRPQAFWFAVMETRTAYNEVTGAPAFEIHPGGWVLAMEDRGSEFLVQDSDGKQGVLRDLTDIERG